MLITLYVVILNFIGPVPSCGRGPCLESNVLTSKKGFLKFVFVLVSYVVYSIVFAQTLYAAGPLVSLEVRKELKDMV